MENFIFKYRNGKFVITESYGSIQLTEEDDENKERQEFISKILNWFESHGIQLESSKLESIVEPFFQNNTQQTDDDVSDADYDINNDGEGHEEVIDTGRRDQTGDEDTEEEAPTDTSSEQPKNTADAQQKVDHLFIIPANTDEEVDKLEILSRNGYITKEPPTGPGQIAESDISFKISDEEDVLQILDLFSPEQRDAASSGQSVFITPQDVSKEFISKHKKEIHRCYSNVQKFINVQPSSNTDQQKNNDVNNELSPEAEAEVERYVDSSLEEHIYRNKKIIRHPSLSRWRAR